MSLIAASVKINIGADQPIIQFEKLFDKRMRVVTVVFCVICAICSSSVECSSNHSHGIQIITPVKHSYTLELSDLKRILEMDDIKDRHVVVVSIAGAFRQGKSFLMNFFIRYLTAQVSLTEL